MLPYSEQQLIHANVNPATGLATDYLNLFNEAVMLFEMGLDMPDMAEELTDWRPHGYVEHFERSGFEQKDVVVAAYLYAPHEIREDFDASVARALSVFDSSINILLSTQIMDAAARADLETRLAEMKALVIEMDAHIHGRVESDLQSEVDALF
jgi:hypothetical protein